MTIELTPNGVACNLDCPYCYQKQMRDAGNISVGYDMDKMIAGLKREGGSFALFGGEALLMPIKDMEVIFDFGLKTYGQNGIQTNGTLITADHLDLFDRYRVHVGMSVDGPDELNDSRWVKDLPTTRAATQKSHEAIKALAARGNPPSIILTLYRGNAVGDRLDRLLLWLMDLEHIGVKYVRIHLLEVESETVAQTMALTVEENVLALLHLYEFQRTTKIKFDLFSEMANLLMGEDANTTCIWNACDPYTTAAVQGVNGQGERSNCGRTNKDGIDWQKANHPGYERQVMLYQTSQENFGCKDCRFFFACKGQCPGTAENGDWRNRSEHCEIWKAMFTEIEGDLRALGKDPLSLNACLKQLEQVMINSWESGRNISIQNAVTQLRTGQASPCSEASGNRPHGDHWDAPDGVQHSDGPLDIHGDQGNTVMHGDSNRIIPLVPHERVDTGYLGQSGSTRRMGTTNPADSTGLVQGGSGIGERGA